MNLLSNKRCVICGAVEFSILPSETRFKKMDLVEGQYIVRCDGCEVVTRSPSIFSPSFDKNVEIELRQHKDFIGGETGQVADHLIDRLSRAGNIVKEKTVLDIGSGSGAFLMHAKETGWAVHGTEREESSLEKLRNYNIPCFSGDIGDLEFQKTKFDFIHLNHVFEHVEDPLGMLQNVKGLLKDDGLVVMEVPNEFMSFMQFLRRKLGLDGSSHTSYFQHEWFFTPQSLRDVCQRAGFTVTALSTPFWRSQSWPKNILRYIFSAIGYGDVIEIHLTKTA